MNKILIAQTKPQNVDNKTFSILLSQASQTLAILRNDYFVNCQIDINVSKQINNSQLKFLMHLTRILNQNGQVNIRGTHEVVNKIKTISKNLGLFIKQEQERYIVFTRKQQKVEQVEKKQPKLAIGFKNLDDEQIDEDDLLKNQKIDLSKASTGGCGDDKPRACANCNCGRQKDQPLPSKQELVKSVNEGKPVSGCGKCYLGDSFRCATCPYQGLPAFKPGDKLKLVDEAKVVIESGGAVVTQGKVKIEL